MACRCTQTHAHAHAGTHHYLATASSAVWGENDIDVREGSNKGTAAYKLFGESAPEVAETGPDGLKWIHNENEQLFSRKSCESTQ